ncbi:hypothetical protein ACLB2K_005588 [Fragaria x ananassa]
MAQPVRSISLPSRLNPISQKIESELNKLRTCRSSSPLGSESLLINLSGLAELFNSIEELVQSQLTQQALNHQQCKALVEETLEGSVWLLDSCGNARDLLLTMKQQVQDLQSALRRKKSSIDSSVHAYLCFRKKAKKNVAKSLGELKKMETRFGCLLHLLDVDYNVLIVIKLLRELSALTVSMFQSLFVSLSMPVTTRWSLVSKLKAVTFATASEKEQKVHNEVGTVDVALCSLHKSDAKMDVKKIKSPIRVCIEYKGKKVLNLIESVVYGLVKPPPNSNIASSNSCSFVVKVRESDQENRVFRVHPLSSLPCPPALNWLDFKVLELGKSLVDPNFRCFRAAISSNPDWPAVMVVAYSNLYYCKLGAGACKHVEIEKCSLVYKGIAELHCWRDVVFYKGMFYAVSLDDTTISIDSSLEIKLVKSSPGSPVVPRSFVVYKLNAPERQWVPMRSLNDGIIFVGNRHFDDGYFAAPAQDFPGFHGNHIYFSHKLWFGDLKMEGSLPYSSDEFEDI